MRLENEAMFVLHRRPFGETSVTLELFTLSAGRVGALARGAKQLGAKSGKAALQPGALFCGDLVGTGELLQLRRFELTESLPPTYGERALALIYLNELLIHLVPRNDAHPELFQRYFALLKVLTAGDLAPKLRQFERALLDELGYGVDFECDAIGLTIAASGFYRIDPHSGFFPVPQGAHGAIAGAAILEFNGAQFSRQHARTTRWLMRTLISEQLGGKTLKSWDLLTDLADVRRG
jgi:DNA repair protein RecO (recombination protein O)